MADYATYLRLANLGQQREWGNLMPDQLLHCSVDHGVAVITLNRPDQLNAISPELGQAYDRCMVELALARHVRVIVITGAGRGFCAGADAGRLSSLAADGGASLTTSEASPFEALTSAPPHLRQRYLAPAAAPQPVIAAINGACVGAGLALAVACDMRFASSTAFFSTIFSRRGLVAEAGLSWTLPRLVGLGAANDMLLTGRRIDAATALRIGLVNEVLEPTVLMEHVLAYARDIAANTSPRSTRIIKAQLRAAEGETRAEAILASTAAVREAVASVDFKESVAAMRERRPPTFPDPELS